MAKIAYCQYFRDPSKFDKLCFQGSSCLINRSQTRPGTPAVRTLTILFTKICIMHVFVSGSVQAALYIKRVLSLYLYLLRDLDSSAV